MIRTGKLNLSPSNRKHVKTDGVDLFKTTLITSTPDDAPAPNAFLIEQGPNATIRSHYHVNSQWQVFVNGGGALGRRPVQPFMAQYVAPHTGYGPIVAGPVGLWYMTLRPSLPSGAQYLPELRDKLDKSLPKYQVTSESFFPGCATSDVPVVEMIAPEENGLAAWMVHVSGGRTLAPPQHDGGLARYYVVAQGEMMLNGEQLGPLSIAWVSNGSSLPQLEAGPEGLDVIVLQFPGNAI